MFFKCKMIIYFIHGHTRRSQSAYYIALCLTLASGTIAKILQLARAHGQICAKRFIEIIPRGARSKKERLLRP